VLKLQVPEVSKGRVRVCVKSKLVASSELAKLFPLVFAVRVVALCLNPKLLKLSISINCSVSSQDLKAGSRCWPLLF
jgi:hypothetical protein